MARGHGSADVEQESDRNARLKLEHLEKELLEAHVGAPVDGPEIIALMEAAVVEKLLSRSREVRQIVTAHQTWKGLLPHECQALQAFQKMSINERFRHVSNGAGVHQQETRDRITDGRSRGRAAFAR